MKEKSLYDAFYENDEKEPVEKVFRPRVVRYHSDPLKYAVNYFRALNFFRENYPKSEWHVQYLFNPFDLEYNGFLLVKKEQKTWNPFSDRGTAENLWKMLRDMFPEFMLEEQFFYRRDYDKEFLLRFLIGLGYDHPADKRLHELYNPFTMEKIPVLYDEHGQRYLIVNGQREYARKPTGR